MTSNKREIFRTVLGYTPLAFFLIYTGMTIIYHLAFIVPTALYGYYVFRGTQDLVQGVGPVYWINRKDTRWFSIGLGTMHELSSPWRKGSGVYIALCKRSFQIGLCRKQNMDEVNGTLSAVGGKWLSLTPKEIGNWNVQEATESGAA